jgi:hypothetical protein
MRTTTALAVLVVAVALAASACDGSSPKTAQTSAAAAPATSSIAATNGAHSYADVQSLLAAMAQGGAACSDVSLMTAIS